jgi:type II secretory pathway predicted ATPase ExeA/LysM repeat protein
MGKTSLLYHYLSYLRDKARTAFVFRTDCDSREFIRHLLLDLGVDVAGMDLPAMHDTLNRLLTDEMRAGRRFVLVIDEAQNLEEKVLESVRLLSNFETPWMKMMQIVLAGQPQLADRLASPSMAQLRQRISMVIRIEPFTHQDVNAYIDHRLRIGGCTKPSLFTAGARKLIAEHSEGIPRNINNLCFNAMSLACALQRKTIDRDVVLDVIADLDLEPLREKKVVAEKSAGESKQISPIVSSAAKKQSGFSGWNSRLAIAGALLFALSWLVVQVDRSQSRTAGLRAGAATVAESPISAFLVSAVPAEPVPLKTEQTPKAIRVMPGQTLYQISVEELGKYDGKVLEQLRELNPWLSDPDHIQSGQKIRMPSATTVSTDVQRAAEQASNAAPAEAGKQ